MSNLVDSIQQAKIALATAESVTVLTGAGISAESGIPTFRGSGGLWREFRAEDLATPHAFDRDPKLVWEWYDWRRGQIAVAKPNPGHCALARLATRVNQFALVTQNVDGLHDLAGSTGVLKIHGDIWELPCTGCERKIVDRRFPLPRLPPLCAACGSMLRPGVVWFGEPLPEAVWEQAVDAASHADILLVVGTSARVFPVASLVPIARRAGAKIIEVNVAESGMSSEADLVLRGPAGEVLPEVIPE